MTNIRRKISSKKNVFIVAALIALMAIGSTFAYFVDRDYVANNFTVGDVEISVSEPNWDPDEGTVKTANYDGTLNARANQDLFIFTANSGWKLIKSDNGAFSSEYVYAYAGDKRRFLSKGER